MNDNIGCLGALVMFLIVIMMYVAFAFVLSLPVMWLWNWLMPALFGLKTITWVEALGISLLCNFLFKGSSISLNKNKQ